MQLQRKVHTFRDKGTELAKISQFVLIVNVTVHHICRVCRNEEGGRSLRYVRDTQLTVRCEIPSHVFVSPWLSSSLYGLPWEIVLRSIAVMKLRLMNRLMCPKCCQHWQLKTLSVMLAKSLRWNVRRAKKDEDRIKGLVLVHRADESATLL
eukprot:807185-Amphidinium_carterae.1